jgi:hypothetical protein
MDNFIKTRELQVSGLSKKNESDFLKESYSEAENNQEVQRSDGITSVSRSYSVHWPVLRKNSTVAKMLKSFSLRTAIECNYPLTGSLKKTNSR